MDHFLSCSFSLTHWLTHSLSLYFSLSLSLSLSLSFSLSRTSFQSPFAWALEPFKNKPFSALLQSYPRLAASLPSCYCLVRVLVSFLMVFFPQWSDVLNLQCPYISLVYIYLYIYYIYIYISMHRSFAPSFYMVANVFVYFLLFWCSNFGYSPTDQFYYSRGFFFVSLIPCVLVWAQVKWNSFCFFFCPPSPNNFVYIYMEIFSQLWWMTVSFVIVDITFPDNLAVLLNRSVAAKRCLTKTRFMWLNHSSWLPH